MDFGTVPLGNSIIRLPHFRGDAEGGYNDRLCEGFRTPAATNVSTRTAAGVRKPPRDETAGRGTYWAVPRAQLWGFGRGRATAEIGSAVGWAGGDGVAAWMGRGFSDLRAVCAGRSVRL